MEGVAISMRGLLCKDIDGKIGMAGTERERDDTVGTLILLVLTSLNLIGN